jgi:hypothetical protein
VGSSVSQRSGKKQRVMEVIDLTLSSDEEDEVAIEKDVNPTEISNAKETPVKSESTQEIPEITSKISNGHSNAPILPVPTTYHINNEHAPYGNGSTSWSGNHSTITATDNVQSGIDRQPLWLPPLRNGSGSPRQYHSPLRNLSPISTSSQLSSNYDQSNSIPPVSRLVLDGWNGFNGDRES